MMFLSGFTARLRVVMRRLAFGIVVGTLFGGALAFLLAAGVIVVAERFGIVAGLLSGAGLLFLLGLVAAFVGRPRPVAAEAVPPPPAASAQSTLAGLVGPGGLLPDGTKEVVAGVVARQLAVRPARTLGVAVGLGTALTVLTAARRRAAKRAP